jgi:DNA invertase Pin-like site-specific DNA recombinase
VLRCAIYTRKSSEEGLEQDFNSLHAQRESCEAYIKSQKHEGWAALPANYDDGGYSGGTMERPALKRLLADIQSGSVNVVVVYKVDRLTRSLADFAKIVELFDAAKVSFVSVTQQFNTTSSMGRLTLNVLLSFAQFEREVTGERIRDKIAASKKKGMWMGGWVPLGYERKDRTLVVNEPEARTVRTIFDLFLKLKNVREVQKELARLGLKTKPYAFQRGRATGNLSFARGHIYRILSNPLYIAEIEHNGVRHPGQHPALIYRDRWDAVQAQLALNRHANRVGSNTGSTNFLSGLLHDQSGNRLVSSYATKNGKRYRYYVSQEANGRLPSETHGKKLRLPAAQVDELVMANLQAFLKDKQNISAVLRPQRYRAAEIGDSIDKAGRTADELAGDDPVAKHAAITDLVSRVLIMKEAIQIRVRLARLGSLTPTTPSRSASRNNDESYSTIEVPFSWDKGGGHRLLIEAPAGSQPDPVTVKAIARAHQWFEDLSSGRAGSMAEIATRENITDNYVSNLIHLAWLPPKMLFAKVAFDKWQSRSLCFWFASFEHELGQDQEPDIDFAFLVLIVLFNLRDINFDGFSHGLMQIEVTGGLI